MIKLIPTFFRFSSKIPKFSFSKISGDLYTWGQHSEGTGYDEVSTNSIIHEPRKLDAFNGNVEKVSMGRYHTAVITNDGNLYTFGCGKRGELGQKNHETLIKPTMVEFFVKKAKKVVDVCCDGDHTVALTEDGDLWTFGKISFGSIDRYLNLANFGLTQKINVPTKIGELAGKKILSISSGDDFVSVITDKHEVYQWGRGDEGNFGDGTRRHHISPQVNEQFEILKNKRHLNPLKIKSCGLSTVVLLSNGTLLGTGNNVEGQLGIRHNVGITLDERVNSLTPIVDENFFGKKIKDFDLGENSLLILTEDNKVYFSGLALSYKPVEWVLPTKAKVTKLHASYETFGVLTEENKIYAFNENLIQSAEYDYKQRIWEINDDIFGKGKILEIGGAHNIHYAIVKH